MKTTCHVLSLIGLLGSSLAGGCDRRQSAPAPAAVAPTPAAGLCFADSECGDRQLCVIGRCTDLTPKLVDCGLIRVHFSLDSALIPPEDQPRLDRVARCLRAGLASHVTIEGNTDERGPATYNSELGERRAAAVADYLHFKNVPPDKVKTVSFGEEHPLCVKDDEECYARNRRAAVRTAPKDARPQR